MAPVSSGPVNHPKSGPVRKPRGTPHGALRWLNEAIGDIKDGLDRADRFPVGTRHFRSVIAITELDHVARHCTPGTWGAGDDEMLDVLTESWVGSIGRH